MVRLLALTLCIALAAGCDSQAPCDATSCPSPPGAPPPTVIDGVDLTALFAAPTAAERETVAARLGAAPATEAPPVVSVAAVLLRTEPDATRFVRLDLRGAGGETLAYGLARVPAAVGGEPLGTVVLLSEAPGDVSEALFLSGPALGRIEGQTVQVLLASRGATLTARAEDGETVRFTSTATEEPYQTDVADLLALTERLGDVPRSDPARLAAVGVGRGGTAALLAAERVPARFRVVGTLSAPTSLFDATVQADAEQLLRSGTRSRLPSADVLFAPVLALRTGTIGLAEARLRLLALSPVTLADRLPALAAVHAFPDGVVPTAHLDRLDEATNRPGAPPRRFTRVEDTLHEDIAASPQARAAIAFFLSDNL